MKPSDTNKIQAKNIIMEFMSLAGKVGLTEEERKFINARLKELQRMYIELNKENNMKPFDIEFAKQGKPVCLRDGRKARIICFDVKNRDYSIIALVEDGEYEVTLFFNKEGRVCSHLSGLDLMMASEKKTGWINIYPYQCGGKIAETGACVYKTQKEAKEGASDECIATIPIEWEE